MLMGHDVTVLDNFFSGTKTAVSHWVLVLSFFCRIVAEQNAVNQQRAPKF